MPFTQLVDSPVAYKRITRRDCKYKKIHAFEDNRLLHAFHERHRLRGKWDRKKYISLVVVYSCPCKNS